MKKNSMLNPRTQKGRTLLTVWLLVIILSCLVFILFLLPLKPVVKEKGTTVYVNQFSPESNPLYVAIFDENNDIVHEEVIKGKMEIGRIYDFSKSKKGHYRLYFESNGMTDDYMVYIEK